MGFQTTINDIYLMLFALAFVAFAWLNNRASDANAIYHTRWYRYVMGSRLDQTLRTRLFGMLWTLMFVTQAVATSLVLRQALREPTPLCLSQPLAWFLASSFVLVVYLASYWNRALAGRDARRLQQTEDRIVLDALQTGSETAELPNWTANLLPDKYNTLAMDTPSPTMASVLAGLLSLVAIAQSIYLGVVVFQCSQARRDGKDEYKEMIAAWALYTVFALVSVFTFIGSMMFYNKCVNVAKKQIYTILLQNDKPFSTDAFYKPLSNFSNRKKTYLMQ